MSDETQILDQLRKVVVEGDDEGAKQVAEQAAAAGIDAQKAIMDGLAAGMAEMGRLYEEGECFVPELMVSSEALYAGLSVLKPLVVRSEEDGAKRGVVVIGVVQGDIHDIGKNLVKMMLEVSGLEIHDLGRDVEMERFIEEVRRVDADLLCLSSLMTTTMIAMKDYLPEFRAQMPDVKIMIGGAPLNQHLADEWGAHGYAENAVEAARVAMRLLGG